MDRLSLFLSLMSGAAITGTLVIVAFSLGYVNWWAIGLCAVVGFGLAWPSAYLISRRIKRQDPEWHPDRDPGDYGTVPKRDAPEV